RLTSTPHSTLYLHDALPISERGRQITSNTNSGCVCAVADLLVPGERFVDALVDVPAAEGFGRGREDRDFADAGRQRALEARQVRDRKSTRLNSSHVAISYAV